MIGSKNFDSYEAALEFAIKHVEIKGAPRPKASAWIVKPCLKCGEYMWGCQTTRYCPECNKLQKQEYNREYSKKKWANKRKKPTTQNHSPITYSSMSLAIRTALQSAEMSEKVQMKRKKIFRWNEEHTCPFADCNGHSAVCQACMRGESYAGFTNLSARRCNQNPISPTGERYILRAKDWKNSNESRGLFTGQQYDVADYMPEHLKVELVQRMQDLGRELYLWSNGHLDITKDPNCNSELRQVSEGTKSGTASEGAAEA